MNVKAATRIGLTGIGLGVALIPADNYWGKGDGIFGCWILGMLLLGGLLFNFFAVAQTLIQPRRLDFPFVAGSDFAGRKKRAIQALLSTGSVQFGVPILAELTLGISKSVSAPMLAGVAAIYVMESLTVTGVLLLLVRAEWLPLSRRAYAGETTSRPPDLGWVKTSTFIRFTYAAANFITAWLPSPYQWLLRRKLLYLFRMDTVSLAFFLFFLVVLGIQLALAWSLFAAGIYALTGTIIALTMVQVAGSECEEYSEQCGYFLPRPWFNYRANVALMLAISVLFSTYFIVISLAHMGISKAMASQGFWQTPVTAVAFALMLMAEKPTLVKSSNSRAVVNFGYLGIAGINFMFPILGLALSAGVGLISGWICLRIARSGSFISGQRKVAVAPLYSPRI